MLEWGYFTRRYVSETVRLRAVIRPVRLSTGSGVAKTLFLCARREPRLFGPLSAVKIEDQHNYGSTYVHFWVYIHTVFDRAWRRPWYRYSGKRSVSMAYRRVYHPFLTEES
jgi:hypothetical protein